VNVTGDVFVLPGATLTITPGTIIRVSPVDRASAPGFEVLADGFNDDDPTRLKEYDETHVSITGKIIALGTKENPIVFTSAAENPRIADWAQLNLEDGSRLDYVIVEYLRTASTNGDDVEITNSVFRHAMWGGISLGDKNPKIINNTIHDCGHEGLDVHGGAPYIANNLVYDCNTGIVVISDDLEVVRGHFLKGRSKPVVVNNTLLNNGHGIFILNSDGTFENNTVASPTGPRPPRGWCYKDFCYENKGGGAAVSIEGNSTPVFVNNSFADRAG
jgi:parallel beta-helix repeat protein